MAATYCKRAKRKLDLLMITIVFFFLAIYTDRNGYIYAYIYVYVNMVSTVHA